MRSLSLLVGLSAAFWLVAAHEAKAERNDANEEMVVAIQDLNLTDEQSTKIAGFALPAALARK